VDIFSTKQPLQEKLDIDSEESDLHALNIICDTDKDNDDFCVDFMDEEDNWREVFLLKKIIFFLIFHCWCLACSFLYLYKAFFIVIDFN
jgi:hypothetical protein